MKPRISYVTGYGWHCGRLLLWPVLLVASVVVFFVLLPFQLVLQGWSGVRLPFGLVVPIAAALLVARRLRRKLRGEPFLYDPLFDDASEVDLIRRDERPVAFRRLLDFELLIWGTSLALLTGLLLLARWP